ncbi:MAG: hypothetical protein V8S82_08650 [Eubacteriales bacterium]
MEDLENSLHSENSVEAEYIAEEVGKVINDYVKTLTERRRYIFIDRFYLAETVDSIASNLRFRCTRSIVRLTGSKRA